MINKYNKIIKVLIVLTVIISIIINRPFYAANNTEQEKIKTSVEKISVLLEDAIKQSYSKAEKYVKRECIQQGYDYYLTMESFYNQDNPYYKIDYIDIISAYLTAKQYSNTLEICDFYSLPFITVEIEKANLTEYVPMAIQSFEEKQEGIYQKSGIIYIDTPKMIDVYKSLGNGNYCKENKQEKIIPDTTLTQYGEVKLTGLEPEDILKIYKLTNNEKALKTYKEKCVQLEHILNGKGLKESMFLNLDYITIDNEMNIYIETLLKNDGISELRRQVISVATSLIGKVPYQWGGKATKPGYDTSWWSIGDDSKQKGLDCSGFVQWCYITAGYDSNIYNKLLSTTGMLDNLEPIMEDELSPGDLGFLHNGRSDRINHVGIYVGEGTWIHCSSQAKTVTVEKTDMFQVFKKMPTPTDNINLNTVYKNYNKECSYSEEDIELVAKLIVNEANSQGINGWIAVAEVVKNRLSADIFPDTVKEVIYQTDQFANNKAIEGRTPSKEQITVAREVLAGNMSILNNPYVLFFRNADGSTEDWGKYSYFTTIVDHQFYIYMYMKGEKND